MLSKEKENINKMIISKMCLMTSLFFADYTAHMQLQRQYNKEWSQLQKYLHKLYQSICVDESYI